MELLIHPEELTPRWIDLAKTHGLKRLSIHPWGGKNAHKTLAELVETLERPDYRAMIDSLIDGGVEIGYEFHAAAYLLPRDLFETHPEYFRMDEEGNRTPDRNFCFSNPEALDLFAKNAAVLAKRLYRTPHDYYFWLDDSRSGGRCYCPACRERSFSDHQLNVMNRTLREIRKDDPEAKMCYLAYYESLAVPETVKPDEGVFLEYAPIDRFRDLGFDLAGENLKTLKDLLAFFGTKDAKVLEYWYDNSLFSKWKKPPVAFTPDNDAIRRDYAFYRELGFPTLSSFACFLGEDYVALYGEPDLSATGEG